MKRIEDKIIYKYLEGTATIEEKSMVLEYMKADPSHIKEIMTLEESYDLQSKIKHNDSTYLSNARKRLMQRNNAYDKKHTSKALLLNVLKYAAVVLLVFLSTMFVMQFNFANHQKEILVVQVAKNEQPKQITLPDGSIVYINSGSLFKYPREFSKKNRKVELEGIAYFEVTHNVKKPFIVETPNLDVRVLGTIFNINSQKNTRICDVSLIKGMVEVTANDQEGKVVLKPGQKASLDRKKGILSVSQADVKLDGVWRNNLIPFDSASLKDIASVLMRFYDVEIILSPSLPSNTYTGVLQKNKSLDSVLHSLQFSIPFKYKHIGNHIYLDVK